MTTDPVPPEESRGERAPADGHSAGEQVEPVGQALDQEVPGDIPVVLPVTPARPRPHPPFGWAILWNLGLALILFGTIIGIVLMVAVVLAVTGDPRLNAPLTEGEPPIPRILADALAVSFPIAYLAALGFALIALRVVAGRDWRRQIGLCRPPRLHMLLVVVGLPGFVILSDLIARVLIGLFGSTGGANQEQVLREIFLPFPWWLAVLAIGVAPGVVEEVWCRGFLGRGLVGRYGWPLGIAMTSLFFGLLHMFPPWYVMVTATMGIGLHLVYLASRSLWAPILLHTLNNSVSALVSVGVLPGARIEQNEAASPALVALLAVGILAFVGVALATGRVRIVPIDPALPAWEPSFPGVAHPPVGSNGMLQVGRASPSAIACAVISSTALVLLLFR